MCVSVSLRERVREIVCLCLHTCAKKNSNKSFSSFLWPVSVWPILWTLAILTYPLLNGATSYPPMYNNGDTIILYLPTSSDVIHSTSAHVQWWWYNHSIPAHIQWWWYNHSVSAHIQQWWYNHFIPAHVQQWWYNHSRPAHIQWWSHGDTIIPVSYTHLTLPTSSTV